MATKRWIRRAVTAAALVLTTSLTSGAQTLTTQLDRPDWEGAVTAGVLLAKPGNEESPYQDDWYEQARYSVSLGKYWTTHLKTEVEFAHSTEGSRYVQDVITLPNGSVQPYSFESFHRLQQASARLVWQFGDNAWVHPYLGAGVAIDIDRRRVFGPPQFGDGPGNTLVPPVRGNGFSGKTLDTRVGVSLSGGAKAYVSRNAFFSGGAAGTVHKHGGTFSLVGGFGFDF